MGASVDKTGRLLATLAVQKHSRRARCNGDWNTSPPPASRWRFQLVSTRAVGGLSLGSAVFRQSIAQVGLDELEGRQVIFKIGGCPAEDLHGSWLAWGPRPLPSSHPCQRTLSGCARPHQRGMRGPGGRSGPRTGWGAHSHFEFILVMLSSRGRPTAPSVITTTQLLESLIAGNVGYRQKKL